MAKGRSGANRGWRSKMKKHLAENPELQAEVNALKVERLTSAKTELQASQEAVSAELTRIQTEIDSIETAS